MAANSEENSMSLLTRWRNLHLKDKCGPQEPASKSDVLRNLLGQVEWSRAAQLVTVKGYSDLFHKYADRYASLIDSPEDVGGVDNFAAGALALQNSRRNESKDWCTGFTRQNVMQLPCVQRCLKVAKAAENSIIPEGKEGDTIPLNIGETKNDCRENGLVAAQLAHNITVPRVGSTGSLHQSAEVTSNHRQYNNTSTSIQSNHSSAFSSSNQRQASLSASNGHRGYGRPSVVGVNGQNPGGSHSNVQEEEPPSFWNLGARQKPGGNQPAPPAARPNRTGNLFSGSSGSPTGASQQAMSSASRFKKVEPVKRPFAEVDSSNENDGDSRMSSVGSNFKTARQQLAIDNQKKFGRSQHGGGGGGYSGGDSGGTLSSGAYGSNKRSLGTRRGLNSKFVPPVLNREEDPDDGGVLVRKAGPGGGSKAPVPADDEPVDERLKNIDEKMIELIKNEIMDHGPPLTWDDIAGLEFAKKTIKEIVVWPMLRPDIFTGLRGPPKGLLLFGPPGTGKTLIGKCIASQSKSTFFSISASSLTSKWIGEGEKMVRALFAVARVHEPAVIFIDEIDSLLSQRTEGEHEASRRIKTEFLVQLDGATSGTEERILVVGATNRPQEIDEAARRRFVKRLYIPLPEPVARRQIIINLMSQQRNQLTEEELDRICLDTDGYSGADMANLCREAALGPIRSIDFNEIENISAEQVRPILYTDFEKALKQVRASVSEKDLDVYLDWNKQFGSWDI